MTNKNDPRFSDLPIATPVNLTGTLEPSAPPQSNHGRPYAASAQRAMVEVVPIPDSFYSDQPSITNIITTTISHSMHSLVSGMTNLTQWISDELKKPSQDVSTVLTRRIHTLNAKIKEVEAEQRDAQEKLSNCQKKIDEASFLVDIKKKQLDLEAERIREKVASLHATVSTIFDTFPGQDNESSEGISVILKKMDYALYTYRLPANVKPINFDDYLPTGEYCENKTYNAGVKKYEQSKVVLSNAIQEMEPLSNQHEVLLQQLQRYKSEICQIRQLLNDLNVINSEK